MDLSMNQVFDFFDPCQGLLFFFFFSIESQIPKIFFIVIEGILREIEQILYHSQVELYQLLNGVNLMNLFFFLTEYSPEIGKKKLGSFLKIFQWIFNNILLLLLQRDQKYIPNGTSIINLAISSNWISNCLSIWFQTFEKRSTLPFKESHHVWKSGIKRKSSSNFTLWFQSMKINLLNI